MRIVNSSEYLEHKEVDKSWGREVWFENNESYCGKLILVYKDLWSSGGKWHYHSIKDETFFVTFGKLCLKTKNEADIEEVFILRKGDSFRIRPGLKHKFTSVEDKCFFIEVSDHHDDKDSYRTED